MVFRERGGGFKSAFLVKQMHRRGVWPTSINFVAYAASIYIPMARPRQMVMHYSLFIATAEGQWRMIYISGECIY